MGSGKGKERNGGEREEKVRRRGRRKGERERGLAE